MKAFSFDLVGEFAFFKKNDANDLVYASYNFIHKPAVLGILGALIGLKGYRKKAEIPEYYERLNGLKIGIKCHYSKPLSKVITVFNNSSGLGSSETGAWQIKEQILVGDKNDNKPEIRYTIFILDDNTRELEEIKRSLKDNETVYPLYFGKNEFFAWHENYQKYETTAVKENEEIFVNSLTKAGKNENMVVDLKSFKFEDIDLFDNSINNGNIIFENLPYALDEFGFYRKDKFLFSQCKLVIKKPDGFYTLKKNNEETINVHFI